MSTATAAPPVEAAPAAVKEGEAKPLSELERAPWYSWPMWNWISPQLDIGSARMAEGKPMEMEDLFSIPECEDPEAAAAKLKLAWEEELLTPEPSLVRALRKTFKTYVMIGGMFRLISDGCAFGAPFILKYFVLWIQSNDPAWHGWLYAISLGLCNLLMSVTLAYASHFTLSGFASMQNALTVMVFDSVFKFKNNHGRSGNLISAHAGDTAKLSELAMFVHGVWVSPILVVGALIALYFFIGWAGLIGVALMILTTPLQGKIMANVFALRGLQVKKTDVRVNAINESLQGIRICKFMNWELSFVKRIGDARAEEVEVLERMFGWRVLFAAMMNSIPQLITFSLFTIAYAINGDIKSEDVFPALSMINVIRIPMMFIPMSIGKLFETQVSMQRLQNILLYNERREFVRVENDPEHAAAVSLVDVTVMGGKEPILSNVSLDIPRGKLTIVTGATASGKSSLINAIIGECDVSAETVVVRRGTLAYVPQDAWIQNATVRQNITFGKAFDEERYIDTLISCELMSDLKQLTASDATDIGERGINLSGGQKQRVALARATYSDRDIIVMDDPLSAVDPHVCRALFEKCMCGQQSGKTRVLVTHQVQFLPRADHIIMMDHCKVVYEGTYEGLVKAGLAPNTDGVQAEGDEGHKDEKISRVIPPPPAQDHIFTAEENKFGDVSWDTYFWYVRMGTHSMFGLTILMSLLWTGANVVFNLFLAWWSAGTEVGGRKLSTNEYIMWFGILCIIAIILVFLRQLAYSRFALNVASSLHGELVANILRAPTSFFDTTPIGRIMNRFTKDVEAVDNRIPETSVMVINLGFNILSMVVLVSTSSPYLIAMFPILLLIFRVIYRYYAQTVRGVKRLEGISRSPMMAIMGETIGGLASIRAYGIEEQLKKEHCERVRRCVRPGFVTRLCQRWLSSRTEFLGSLVVTLTGVLAVLTNTTPGGWNTTTRSSVVALSISYALATTNAITFLTRSMGDLESDMASTERVMEYASQIPQERDFEYTDADGPHPPPHAGWPATSTVSFRNVWLRYREGLDAVLKGVSFDIANGQRVGLVGRTGSGKSTIMLALFRIVEIFEGEIVIDGVKTSDLKLQHLREQITIIPQDPVLFSGTVKTNLDPFGVHSEDRLWEVVRQVGLEPRLVYGASGQQQPQKKDAGSNDPFTEPAHSDKKAGAPAPNVLNVAASDNAAPSTPAEAQGLETKVQDKGANFSVGQRQLICLARALLKNTRILLMDEATASVDFETDALIQRTVREAFKGATVLTIAHRLATVIDSDHILVMDAGRVAEYDTPSTLLANASSVFHGMVSQLGTDQFEQLKAVADGTVSYVDKLAELAQFETIIH